MLGLGMRRAPHAVLRSAVGMRPTLISSSIFRAQPSMKLGLQTPARSFFNFPSLFGRSSSNTTIQNLAQKEHYANANLNDATAQSALYRDLLESHYPTLVVHRYETAGVARNAEAEQLYAQALRQVSPERFSAYENDRLTNASGATAGAGVAGASASNASGVGSGSADTKMILESLRRLSNAKGASNDPVHVIVSETPMGMLLKWLKWLIPLLLAVYVVATAITFVTDSSSVLRGIGGMEPNGVNKMDQVRGEKSTVRFKDVLGADEARNELEEIVEFLKDPSQFTGLGGKLPKGVLLTGPPGTGKTLLARAVAGEAGVPFFFMSGSEFDELYVGVGAKRIRELFSAARNKAPAIVFIDELDAIGGKRNPKDQAYSKQTLNQLLVDLDGFNQTEGVIFMAATNFPEMLDKALTRPGRFDKIVNVELPDVRGRAAILKYYTNKVEIDKHVNVLNLARGTPGFSGADLQNLVNQAAIYASSHKAKLVNANHLEWAKDKILLGGERKSMVMTEETRRNTAFHEAGHAIMALYTPGATPLYKATVLPRGSALGITFQLPELDKYDQTRAELLAKLDVCMGGKVAEELLHGFENVTSGCYSDLKQATSVARAMVTGYGMSQKIGPIDLSESWQDWSAETRYAAEQEIRDLLLESAARTRKMLEERELELHRLAEGLIKYETLDKEDIERIVEGESIEKEPTVTNTVVKSEEIRDKRGLRIKAPASQAKASSNNTANTA